MKPSREQSGVLPYRRSGKIEVCLIKTKSGKSWGIPKGGVEPALTPKVSALKEAMEEAGLQGKIVNKIGKYSYTKGGVKQKVTVFLMLVDVAHEHYMESDTRKRKWFTLDKAREKIDPQLEFLLDALEPVHHEHQEDRAVRGLAIG